MTDTHTTAHIPDEAVQAANTAYDEYLSTYANPQQAGLVDAMLSAALPHLSAPCAVEVKKLEWVEVSYGFIAHTPFGTYKLSLNWGDHCKTAMVIAGGELPKSFHDAPDEAKAAAQADFERRIFSNVVTKPVDVAAVRDALRMLLDAQPRIDSNEPFDGDQSKWNDYCDAIHEAERAISAEPTQCKTCNGHGIVGGMITIGGGEVDCNHEDCPDCTDTEPAKCNQWQPTHRHVKRGTEYQLVGIGKVQAEDWYTSKNENIRTVDMREVAIYCGDDGQLWVRPIEDFNDGRFEVLPATPTSEAGR